MGAITAVPREVVPLVNHSPGFAMRCGSDVLSQADIAGFWGLAGLTAAGGKGAGGSRSHQHCFLCSLLTIIWAAGAGENRTCQALYAARIKGYGPLLLRRWPESDEDCSPLPKSLTTCHIGPGLCRGEENLPLCETAQVAKSCLFPSLPPAP